MGTNFTKLSKKLPLKNLYDFWGDKISNSINEEDCKYLINLASDEYFSAVNPQKISSKIIHITFKEKRNGALKIIGLNAKRARGAMANFAIKNKITDPQKLKNFRDENYSFTEKLSDQSNWVFIR